MRVLYHRCWLRCGGIVGAKCGHVKGEVILDRLILPRFRGEKSGFCLFLGYLVYLDQEKREPTIPTPPTLCDNVTIRQSSRKAIFFDLNKVNIINKEKN